MNKEEMIRNRIIAAAKELLDQAGERQLTISEICAKSAISKSTFYKYFSSKEKLIEHIAAAYESPVIRIDTMKDLILATSKELISSKGFDNISMNDIAKEVGIKRTSLYSYFSSISEIAQCILTEELKNREQKNMAAADSNTSIYDMFEYFIDYHLNLLKKEYTPRLIVEMLEKCYINKEIKDGIEKIESLSIKNMSQVIELGKSSEVFSDAMDAHTYATLVYIFSYGTAIYTYLHPQCALSPAFKVPILELLLNGMKKR